MGDLWSYKMYIFSKREIYIRNLETVPKGGEKRVNEAVNSTEKDE